MFHSELLWSLMAPVDISHQGCLIKINNLHLSVRCDGRLGTLNVRPAHSAYATWQQDFKSCATTGITQVLYSSWGFSNDLLARNNHPALENARLFHLSFWCAAVCLKGPSSLKDSCSLLWSQVERFYFAFFWASHSVRLLFCQVMRGMVRESSNQPQRVSESSSFFLFFCKQTNTVLDSSTEFVSRNCSYDGNSLFTLVTHVWCSLCFVNYGQKALFFKGFTVSCFTNTQDRE